MNDPILIGALILRMLAKPCLIYLRGSIFVEYSICNIRFRNIPEETNIRLEWKKEQEYYWNELEEYVWNKKKSPNMKNSLRYRF